MPVRLWPADTHTRAFSVAVGPPVSVYGTFTDPSPTYVVFWASGADTAV